MKKLVKVTKTEGQELKALIGKKVTFFCLNYIYHGKLTGVNTTDLIIEDAYLVYETGDFSTKGFQDAQFIGKEWRLKTSIIESYGVLENK